MALALNSRMLLGLLQFIMCIFSLNMIRIAKEITAKGSTPPQDGVSESGLILGESLIWSLKKSEKTDGFYTLPDPFTLLSVPTLNRVL